MERKLASSIHSSVGQDPPSGIGIGGGEEELLLHEVKVKLSNIPHDEKSALVHVQRISPEMVNDEHIMRFLRVENFDVDLATKRLVRYWDARYKIFGPDRFALPMTLAGAMKDSIDSLKRGIPTLLPQLDDGGRAIIYNDWSLMEVDNSGAPLNKDELTRVVWYLLHVAMENPIAAKNGFVSMSNMKSSQVHHMDGSEVKDFLTPINNALPIKWKQAHLCQGHSAWPYVASIGIGIVVHIFTAILKKEMVVFHSGSQENILESLSKYMIPLHCVPSNLGGTLKIDTSSFLEQQLVTKQHITSTTFIPLVTQKGAQIAQDERYDTKNEHSSSSSQKNNAGKIEGETMKSSENMDDVSTAIHAVKGHLSNIPHEEKSAIVHVQHVRPELVNDKHILQFLRVEKFDINLATQRLVRYWETRYTFFGPDRYALPMTLDGAMKGSIDAVKKGLPALLSEPDEMGRAILYIDWNLIEAAGQRTGIADVRSIEEFGRVWWYLMHVMMENPTTAKKGYVILDNAEHSRMNIFDTKSAVALCRSAEHSLPLQWGLVHFCHGSTVLPLIAQVAKNFLSPRQRDTFLIHSGSKEGVLESLSKHKMPKHCVPASLGGTLNLDTYLFVAQRLAIERGSSRTSKPYAKSLASPKSIGQPKLAPVVNAQEDAKMPAVPLEEGVKFNTFSYINNSPNATSINSSLQLLRSEIPHIPNSLKQTTQTPESTPKKAAPSSKATKLYPIEPSNTTKMAQTDANKIADENKPRKRGAGRAGDPRMRLAVETKLNNPDISFVSALIAGGFVFPGLVDFEKAKMSSNVLDVDGVTVYQRRNQLMRRLRLAKEKKKKK